MNEKREKHGASGGLAGYTRLVTELPFSNSTVILTMWPLANPLGF